MEGYRTIKDQERVQFSIVEGKDGKQQAYDVRPIGASTSQPVSVAADMTSPPATVNGDEEQHADQRKLNVFLCHSSGDKPLVRGLFDRLSAISYVSPWLDEKSLLPGQDCDLEVARAVRAADCVVVCLSSAAINKEGYVQKEIAYALDAAEEKPEGTIYIIPVRLDLCDPPSRISRWHYVDLFDVNGFEKLLFSLQFRATTLGLLLTS